MPARDQRSVGRYFPANGERANETIVAAKAQRVRQRHLLLQPQSAQSGTFTPHSGSISRVPAVGGTQSFATESAQTVASKGACRAKRMANGALH